VADGRRGAVIGPSGDIAWLCAPSWDSPAFFSALVGGEGTYAVTPVDPFVWGGFYEPGSLIWRSRWVTTATEIESRDALAYPGDQHCVVLLRRVEAADADAVVDVVLDLRADFGRRQVDQPRRDEHGVWTATTDDLRIRWTGASAAGIDSAGALRMRLHVPAGSHHDLVLEISDRSLGSPVDPDRTWAVTEAAWQEAVPTFEHSISPRDARQSYAVLRGLTAPGGGMVAAATLGLPERARAGRNYDYRYVWLRDQAYAGLAAGVDEPHPLLDDAVAFVSARLLEHGDQVAPAYRVDGGDLPHESTLGLPGYPGGCDVVGNWVNGQFQLDAIGESLQLFAAAARHDHLTEDSRRAVAVAVSTIAKRWNDPEAGIWELDNQWWTQSRLSCVAGLRVVAKQELTSDTAGLSILADRLLAETSRRCVAPDGSWQRSPDHPRVDSSLLLPPVRGALAHNDPRTVATVRAVERTIVEDGYAYRFDPGEGPLGSSEGAFLLCGFMMALAKWQQGDTVGAFRWFERNRAAVGAPGILTEEFDVSERQLRGNFPQAFVHAMLLETSQRLTEPYDPGEPSPRPR